MERFGGSSFVGAFGLAIWPWGELRVSDDELVFRTRWLPWPYSRSRVTVTRADVDVVQLTLVGALSTFLRVQALGQAGETLGRRGSIDQRGAVFLRRFRAQRVVDALERHNWPVDLDDQHPLHRKR